MPKRDKTGPSGVGPGTGLGRGGCRGAFAGRYGCCGYGRMRGTPAALTKEDEKKVLEIELKDIEAEKQAVEKRLKELK